MVTQNTTASAVPLRPVPLPSTAGGSSGDGKPPNRKPPSVLTDEFPFFVRKPFYRVCEVAEILGVSEDTVRRLARLGEFGEVVIVKVQPKGKRRWVMMLIPLQGLLSFLERHKRGGR